MRGRLLRAHALVIGAVLAVGSARAGDGRIEISQSRALAGGLTEFDAPGFPVTLRDPGSYVLTTNLVVGASETAIEVLPQAGPVTIDLNGFALIGPRTCTVSGSHPTSVSCTGPEAGDGIAASEASDVSIRNGNVRGFRTAVDLGPRCRVDRVRVTSNAQGVLGSEDCIVTFVIAAGNESFGVGTLSGSVVEDSVAYRNQEDGIFSLAATLLRGNVARGNLNNIITSGSALIRNAASGGVSGISAGERSLVFGNAVVENDSALSTGQGTLTVDTVLHTGGVPGAFLIDPFDAGVRKAPNACEGSLSCP